MHLIKFFFFTHMGRALRACWLRLRRHGGSAVAPPSLAALLAAQHSGARRTAPTAALGRSRPRREGVPAAGNFALCGARAGFPEWEALVEQNAHFV